MRRLKSEKKRDADKQSQLIKPSLPSPSLLLNDLSPYNLELRDRTIRLIRLDPAHPLHDAHATRDPTKDGVLSVQPRRGRQRDEELAPVGVGTGVCHGQDPRARVLKVRPDLVLELVAVDGGAAPARARRVAALDHKVANNPVEHGPVVVAPRRERAEVLARLGRVRLIQLHDNGALVCVFVVIVSAEKKEKKFVKV